MEEEMVALKKNDTWDLVPLPKGHRLVVAHGRSRKTLV